MRGAGGAKGIPPRSATMLFYGAPGTGKTALARYIAQQIGRECLVKTAGDLLGMYVGQTEKAIAKAFVEAEEEGKVLIIDEADSFLYNRKHAMRSWENSMTNAFLTALDDCRCFCICTTNQRENLDEAAMRRFSFKVGFSYAKPEQVITLYRTCLGSLCCETLTAKHEQRLTALRKLAPGDFHSVRAQFNSIFRETSQVNHDDLINALAREQSLKLEEENDGRIGFGA